MDFRWTLKAKMKLKITNRTLDSITPGPGPFDIRDEELGGFIARVHPTGRITFFCDFRFNRVRNRICLGQYGVVSPNQARDEAKIILGEVAANKDPKESRANSQQITLHQFLSDHYGPWVTSHRKSGKDTLQTLISVFDSFKDRPLSEITPWLLERWRTQRINNNVQPATVNRNVNALRSCLSTAVTWDFLKEHPLAGVKPLKVDSEAFVRYLSVDERSRLLEALDRREDALKSRRESGNSWRKERGYRGLISLVENDFADYLKPMILLSLNTGLRQAAIFNLKWSDIDLHTNTLTVAPLSAKSGKTIRVPLNQTALVTICEWKNCQIKESDFVFSNKDGKPFNNVTKSWKAVLQQAGIVNFRWHDMRHDFASQLVMSGVDLNTVRELLGHADLKMTLRYAHLAPEHKARAVAVLDRNINVVSLNEVIIG